MISGLLLVATSAVLGGFLALAARRRPILLELTRTFAFAAAFGVVGFHLVPEILPTLGFEALIWIAAGFALPWILEAGARVLGPGFLARRGRSRRLGGAGREAQRRPAEGEADEQGRSDGEGEGDRGAHDCHHAGLVAEIEKGTEARKAQTQDAGEDV